MVTSGKHHNSALCHIATTLLTRIAACWNNQTPYQLRDLDGRAVTKTEARQIISDHYQIPDELRRARATTGPSRRSNVLHRPAVQQPR